MKYVPLSVGIASMIFCCRLFADSSDTSPLPQHEPEKDFQSSWGKGTVSRKAISNEPSRLEGLSRLQLTKQRELDRPIKIEILTINPKVSGLEEMNSRLVSARLTNPNAYSIFFRGRKYKEFLTIKERLNGFVDGKWTPIGADLCGTRVQDHLINADESIIVLLTLLPDIPAQQVIGTFYKDGEVSTQSDAILYERR